jgi:hypothetical protein
MDKTMPKMSAVGKWHMYGSSITGYFFHGDFGVINVQGRAFCYQVSVHGQSILDSFNYLAT